MAFEHPALALARHQASEAADRLGDALKPADRETFIAQMAGAILQDFDAQLRWQREITLDALARDSGARRAGG